ncbi:MAG: glycosyltransferase, partial [Kofleriaceae bacterium]|nr:glycosyltransferase [Kofleriaceae bacterium]
RPDRVCELVSPLKPFEAMALGCPVVASDVAALADLVVDGVTGRLFRKGDIGALTAVLTELIADPAQRTRLGQAAAAWVRRDRSWDALAVDVDAVWRRLGA